MSDIAGVILAGGLSRRMGGGDKGLVPLADRPLLAHVIDRIAPQVARLAINANGDPARFAHLGLPVITDTLPGHLGPLAGILSAMHWARLHGFAQVLVVPGDAPFLPPDLAARLAPGPAIAASGGRMHPVAGLWDVAQANALHDQVLAGTRKVMDWARDARVVEFTGTPDPFTNLNTPQDFAMARDAL